MRKIVAAMAAVVLVIAGCGNEATPAEREQSMKEIQVKLCFELKDQIKAKADKLDNYGKDDLGSYGYNFVLWQDLCTDAPVDTAAPDDAN